MRTIAEALAYNRRYSPKLNPSIFIDDKMIPQVREKILKIAESFLDYTQVDMKVIDIRLVGSNASYNYNQYSDVDIHIVTDLSKIADPESIARLYFDSVKKNFKDSYDIKIKGMDAELYVEDVNASPVSNGIYSASKDKWIKYPEAVEDASDAQVEEAEQIEEEIMNKLNSANTPEELEEIIDDLYLMRKDSLAAGGENAPGNLAFKSLRNKGVLDQVKHSMRDIESDELSLESKDIREARTQNKYWIYTQSYSFLKREEVARAEFLHDSDNTYAYGTADLIYKLEALRDMNIVVKKIWQTYSDESTKDVTERYSRYLLK